MFSSLNYIGIIYYVLYIFEKCSAEHLILYIDSCRNNVMCEICFVNIFITIFYIWERNSFHTLTGSKGMILQSLDMISCCLFFFLPWGLKDDIVTNSFKYTSLNYKFK
jgi:hypothetical protein